MTRSTPASRAARLYEKRKQALSRGADDRADTYLLLHRAYVAQGMSEFHRLLGSDKTADELLLYSLDLLLEKRTRR